MEWTIAGTARSQTIVAATASGGPVSDPPERDMAMPTAITIDSAGQQG